MSIFFPMALAQSDLCSGSGVEVWLRELRNGQLVKEYLTQQKCETDKATWHLGHTLILQADLDSKSKTWILSGGRQKVPMRTQVREVEGMTVLSSEGRLEFRLKRLPQASLQADREIKWPLRSARSRLIDIPTHGSFGASRKGERKHTGVDIPAGWGEEILSPVHGRVVMITHLRTQDTFFIESESKFWGLAHVKEQSVSIGQQVDPETVLGRAMSKAEMAHTKHAYNHVHLELRKEISDLGSASIDTYSPKDLARVFIDPLTVLQGKK